jgi:hypothetical protein
MEREQRIRGQENFEDDVVKEYLDDLINIVENISNLVENDANLRQDKFLGCIPVTYEYMTGLAMTILPLIGALLQQYIRKEPLEVNPFDS